VSDDQDWTPTCRLRWLASPTPGEPDTLQQLWTKPNDWEGYPDQQQWRSIERVDWSLAREQGETW